MSQSQIVPNKNIFFHKIFWNKTSV